MKQLKFIYLLLITVTIFSCRKEDNSAPLENTQNEDLSGYTEIASINLGGLGAAEISAFDPSTDKLFAVNNSYILNKIDVIDISNPALISVIHSISMLPYGGYVNSVAVSNGKLAAAVESTDKQSAGKIVVFNTSNYAEIKSINVGALPDMVTFTPDGKYILSANEGEPSDNYLLDPEGSVSIIKVSDYSVKTINFSAFESQLAALTAKGFRIFGPGKSFNKDIEPEYITVSDDNTTAYVTLQENNAIAEIDIVTGIVKKIMPLGFKDYSLEMNAIDASDKDSKIAFTAYNKVFGMYMPDAIAYYNYNGKPYLFTANEGDSREYTAFTEMKRAGTVTFDPTSFPTASLKTDAVLGRLNITTTLGDTDGDGDFDALYSLGARSFSVWDATTGAQVFDSKNELDKKATELKIYDDGRSDDKGVEPESVTIGRVGNKTIAIIGMERADAFAIYDITTPTAPVFIKMYKTGDAPEGLLFIPASKSPINQSLIVISSENDGLVKIYKSTKL
ncbi:MAG: choice-of-anchor I family protein [Chitinophagaceae bacterium]|nr:choice-of-anchor I family protein [Chitinophagaceae bacterium]